MKTENPNTPIFGTPEEARVAPKFEMPKTSMPGEVAYQLVHDEAMMDGNARLNLATFVTTWMDDYARRVMTENMDKNMIDKTEYPQTAEINPILLSLRDFRSFGKNLPSIGTLK